MKVFSRTLMCVALSAAAVSANAAVIKFGAAYGAADATAAEAEFLSNSYNQVTETFDLFDASGKVVVAGNQQQSYVQTSNSFNTLVGTFTNPAGEVNNGGDDFLPDNLMIEDIDTGEFGRATPGQWLDSNDADHVIWDIANGSFNAFGFYLSDANDQGASLVLSFVDGTTETLDLLSPLNNGNLMYVTLVSDVDFTGATLTFQNGEDQNDGWGIDNVTIASVPEPGTLALLGLGLAGVGIARRRKQS